MKHKDKKHANAAEMIPQQVDRFSLQITLMKNGNSFAFGNIDAPDQFLGLCLFDAVYRYAVDTTTPLRRITQTDAYKQRISSHESRGTGQKA